MANIMSMKDVKNHVHRNGFDLSRRHLFTAQVGELLPVMCEEVIPGDMFDIDVSSFTRTIPVQTAAFTRIREYYDFYFVPTRLMWDKFPAYIVQTNNYQHSLSITRSAENMQYHPYFSLKDMLQVFSSSLTSGQNGGTFLDELGYPFVRRACRLLQMLGYGSWEDAVYQYDDLPDGKDAVPDLSLNPFPLLAYQKIYQDYFRFQQWEQSLPQSCNLDYIMVNSMSKLYISSLSSSYSSPWLWRSMFALRYANYKKDLFTGLLAQPQFGDVAIASPLVGDGSFDYAFRKTGGYSNTSGNVLVSNNDGKLYDGAGKVMDRLDLSTENNSNVFGISVFALRMAEFTQKYREITNSGDLDYAAQLRKHWNVSTSDFQSDLCQYLGGTSSNLNINEVVNQNLDASTSRAELAGTGRGTAHGHIKRKFNEHGYIMCIYHAEPVLDWSPLGVRKLCTKIQATDYAIPEFDNVGMQQVMSSELLFGWHKQTPSDTGVMSFGSVAPLGYAPRYIEYKTALDMVSGQFLDIDRDWVNPMTVSNLLQRLVKPTSSQPAYTLDYLFFKINPNILDNVFNTLALGPNADAGDTTLDRINDQLRIGAFFDVKAVRNLSVNGLPY